MVRTAPPHDDAPSTVDDMDLVGGELCLDLVNTGSRREEGPFRDRLGTFDDLVRWGLRTGALDGASAERLRAAAADDPAAAGRALERTRALREAIYRVFRARLEDARAAPADLSLLTEAGAEATAAQQLVSTDEGFDLEWPATSSPDRAWWPAATSAVALLLSDELSRVKECATPDCNWLFVDASKNRSRKWCDMKDCGNRAKARRHYARRRG